MKGREGQKSPSPTRWKRFSFRLLAFSFCETCRTKEAIWRRKGVEHMSAYLVHGACSGTRRAAFVMQPLGTSSFTYRRAETQWSFSLDSQQLLSSVIPPLSLMMEGCPWLGAAGHCAGHCRVSSPVLSSLCLKMGCAPHWTSVVSPAGLERTHTRPVAHVTIRRMLECLCLLTLPTKSLPP